MARTIREVINEIQATPDDATTFALLAELYVMIPYKWTALPRQSKNDKTEFLMRGIQAGINEVIRRRSRKVFFGEALDYSHIYEWRKLKSNEEFVHKFVDEPVEVKDEEEQE